jgi:putative peptide zinc metalloprotease protein
MENVDLKNQISTGELRKDLKLFKGTTDAHGFESWVIFDPVSDRYYRISEHKHRIISYLDQSYSLDEFMEKLHGNGVKAEEKDIIILINFLRNSNLLLPEYGVTEKRIMQNVAMKRKMLFTRILSTYMFFRMPLLKPDKFLDKTVDTVRAMFNSWTIMLLVIVSLCGYISLVPNWNKFTRMLWESISFEGLLRYSVAVILIKFVHEFAHAYAAKSCGVRVRRMGVAFIVFFPRLFTDLTDSWRINDRRKRVLIDAAGILAEMLIGGIAALVWTNTGPGATQTISYYIFAVSVINTVLVNGNPFIRYDGYYILMDMVDIDNLQKRGTEVFKAFFRKTFFGLDYPSEKYLEPWKNYFLFIYGILSFSYKLFLYTSIIFIVYIKFTKAIGIVLLLAEVYILILKPISMEGKALMAYRKKFKRRNLVLAYCMIAIIFLPLVVPLPWIVASPCEVRSASLAVLFLQNDGFVEELLVDNGVTVHAGQELLRYSSPFLDWQLKQAEVDFESLELEMDQLQSSGMTIGGKDVKSQQLKAAENLITELRRRRQLLSLRAPISGTFVYYDQDLQAGRFMQRGMPVAQIFDPDKQRVIAYVKEQNIEQIKPGDKVYITMENRLEEVPGVVKVVNPVPLKTIPPSPVLSVFGGSIMALRLGAYEFELVEPYYQVVIIPEDNTVLKCGSSGTMWVRKYSAAGLNMLRKAGSVIAKELSF